MSGAFKTVAADELVTKNSSKNKLTGSTQATPKQSAAATRQESETYNPAGTHFDAGLSDADKARVEAYRQMYYEAMDRGDKTAMEAAHDAAEYVRAGYGYSGGTDGSEYIPLEQDVKLTVPEYSGGTAVEDYSSYLEQMYDAKKQAAMAELKTAYDNSVAELDRAESGLAEGYQAARNERLGAHEQERRSFAEYAAANGLNNGAAGQAELTRGVTLQNNMNAIRTAEASALADLTLQRAEAENEYNAAIAQAEYTGEYELAAAMYEEKVRVQEALIEEEIRQNQYALEQYQLQYQAQRDAVADRQYESEQALKEKEQADNLELAWAAQILKEKDQADSTQLAWAEQILKEKAQADELELAWEKQEDASALDWAAQELAQQKHKDSQSQQSREQLAQTGELYLKAGLMPPEEMREAMGITTTEAHKYILALKTSQK